VISFTVPGTPVAKGRPRLTTRGGFARAFTPAKTVAYEGLVALAGQDAMAGQPPLDCALALDIVAWFPIPPSWSKKKRAAAVFHIGRPDGDNILKAIGDGLNGVVWRDDSLIAQCSITKRYGDTPGAAITVRRL
jgi:Holliday junction resolvase RusA-like endonuclease